MTTWVALLRGVNVNGITIRSAELKELFVGLGFDDVRTVLASGNVRFGADVAASGRADLKSAVETALRERFGYDAWIVLVTLDELSEVIAGFPFDAADPTRHPYVVFCSGEQAREEVLQAAVEVAEQPFAPGEGVLYLHTPVGTSTDGPFARILARARYKSTTTTRNLRTLVKIVS